ELTLRADPAAVADATGRFHTALEIARRQGARSWALRAALSLARVDASGSAQATLSELLEEIAEGFDSPDVVAANALRSAQPAKRAHRKESP
ncbi:MAG: hypothetical protein AB7Q01_17360, partial [Gammaproteobacteria bacterium]